MHEDPLEMVLNKKFKIHWDRILGGLGVGAVSMMMLIWAYSIIPI